MTPARPLVVAAYAAIYLIWGSTFLATRWAVETLPPFAMAGARCTLAGLTLLAIARLAGQRAPRGRALAAAAALGVLLFVFCQGLLATAQTSVPSGLAALFMATIPLAVPLVAWVADGARPGARTLAGAALGLAGVALLSGGGGAVAPLDAARMGTAVLAWAVGTVLSARLPRGLPAAALAAVQLLAGGAALLAVAAAAGQLAGLDPGAVAPRSLAGFAYLTLFGTVVAFGAFAWLVRVEPPARVASYALANPLVALAIGWLFAGEALDAASLAAAALIVGAVALILTDRAARRA